MTMFKTTGNAYEATILCRRCEKEMTINVIELSRLHHPPICAECEAAVAVVDKPNVRVEP